MINNDNWNIRTNKKNGIINYETHIFNKYLFNK